MLVNQNAELRLKSLQLQMNPHFIFNALQSVQSYVLNQNVREALLYIGNLANVIRANLENASIDYIHLHLEIDFLKKYVEIEQVRFKDVLTVDFVNNVVDDNVMLPTMIVQPFIENAIKHGIRSKKSGGHITIVFNANNNALQVIVEDNGIGRERSGLLNKNRHKGKGISIVKERLSLLNTKTRTSLHQLRTIDLYHNGVPSGTRVEISLLLVKSS